MGGLFDDIFDDSDFEIGPEVEELLELDEDDWNDGPSKQKGATWDTGKKPDIWNADEPWTTSDSDCGGCTDGCDTDCSPDKKPGFEVDDFFS